tara:strand:- start:1886 stop:2521 length:636 start_codon:yes stop_codon:yes gene_type:complete
MVSIKTGLTLGLIAAFVLFSNQIGTALGKGVRGFGESVISGITNPLTAAIPTVVTATTPANSVLTNLQKQAGQLQTNIEEAIQAGTNLGGSVNPEASASGSIATAGGTPTVPQAPTPIATSFKSALESGLVEPSFAEKYSFVAPQEGKLDVSKTFQYIADPVSVVGSRQASSIATSRAKSNYGGYSSSINQSTALAQAIQASAAANPEYFR